MIILRGVMALGAFFFLIAAATGIWRIALTRGFLLPPIPWWLPPHGHLMLGGFLAALIQFERMAGLPIRSLVWVPYVYSLSAIFLHLGHWPITLIHLLSLLGWAVHRWLAFRRFHVLEKPLIETLSLVSLSSALLYSGGLTATPNAALTALSFPVATIIIERLEMPLHLKKSGANILVWYLVAWCVLWNLLLWFGFLSLPAMGALTLFLTLGVAYLDIGLRKPNVAIGETYTFQRVALKAAYLWLIAATLVLIAGNIIPGAILKDLEYHLIGLGFIFSMILAHAPFILAAALSRLPPLHPPWIPFLLFQSMTLLRIIGDLSVTVSIPFWGWSGWISGVGNTVAFLIYSATLVRNLRKK